KIVVKTAKKGKEDMERERDFYVKVGDHPNIARFYGIEKVGGIEGLVMEEIKGGDMSKMIGQMNLLVRQGSLSEEDYWGIMQFTMSRTLESLSYIEKKGVLHHDIKEPNIMIDEKTGEPKIIDFGKGTDIYEGEQGTVGHTPLDGMNEGATGKSDVFGVGGM